MKLNSLWEIKDTSKVIKVSTQQDHIGSKSNTHKVRTRIRVILVGESIERFKTTLP